MLIAVGGEQTASQTFQRDSHATRGRGWKGLEGERYVVLFLVLIISQQIKVEGVEPHGIQFAFLAFVTPPARMSSFEFVLVGAFPSIYR